MKRVIILTVILFSFFVGTAATAQQPQEGEVIVHTTTGMRFVGKLLKEDGEKLSLQTRSGTVDIPRSVIDRIERPEADTRPASERIAAQEIPAGEEVAFLEKADEAFKEGKFETVVAICKGLQPQISALAAAQRESMHKMAAAAYFEFKDWKATVVSLRFAARAVEADMDRRRLDAVAEALEASTMPDVAGQTVQNFEQLKTAAMKWKAEQYLNQAIQFMHSQKELHRQEALSNSLDVARKTLGNSEAFVPGFSIERWSDVVKATADYMIEAVERVVPRLTEEREELVRTYVGAISSMRHAAARNELVVAYLSKRSASAGVLVNLQWMEENSGVKDIYKKDKAAALEKKIEDLRFYHRDPPNNRIRLKGLEIKPMSIGG